MQCFSEYFAKQAAAAPPVDVQPAKRHGTQGHLPRLVAQMVSELAENSSVAAISAWFAQPRFAGIVRLHTAREVAGQRGTIAQDYTVARCAAEDFFALLRSMCDEGRSITTFGPYSPGQAVAIKRAGIEGIYLGGWATSAKGNVDEDPGPDLASYPLSRVPDEAAMVVRALLTADKNQAHSRGRMTEELRQATPVVDYRPFIIADADTGHGGDAHVRNLVRRFVEVGVPGYHIEDQKPGVKKCGHQGGKVLVSEDEQIKRMSAARFQLDVMGVAGIIVARTDAESATLLDGRSDERDQPFILGATHTVEVPTFKAGFMAILKRFHGHGIEELSGYQIYATCASECAAADRWLQDHGLVQAIDDSATGLRDGKIATVDAAFDKVFDLYVDLWQKIAGIKTWAEAVADVIDSLRSEGRDVGMTREQWLVWANGVGWYEANELARSMGLSVQWDCEHAKTPDGYYQIRGGIEYAIAKSLAVAPYADILWMETKTADLPDAKRFADAIHARFPGKMLAYNLSPSFNWDTTGMGDEAMRAFPIELGKMGFVFNFITYGGHQIDGMVSEEFAASLRQDGMLALARLQRKFRLVESPYRTPQSLVGGPRSDEALMSLSGRTATTKAMGKGSTQFQHLVQTEVPPKLLQDWLAMWAQHHGLDGKFKVSLRPHSAGSELLELAILNSGGDKVLNVIFGNIVDRRGRNILSIRDQNNFDSNLRKKRLMTLAHIFLIYRYKIVTAHFVTPTEDNQRQVVRMMQTGIFSNVQSELGAIIVADVAIDWVKGLLGADKAAMAALIAKA